MIDIQDNFIVCLFKYSLSINENFIKLSESFHITIDKYFFCSLRQF